MRILLPRLTFRKQVHSDLLKSFALLLTFRCRGDESDIFQCKHDAFGRHNCRASECLGVICEGLPEVVGVPNGINPGQNFAPINAQMSMTTELPTTTTTSTPMSTTMPATTTLPLTTMEETTTTATASVPTTEAPTSNAAATTATQMTTTETITEDTSIISFPI